VPGIRRLNHAVLYVSDARRSAKFYCEVLGFTVVQEAMGGRAVFVRAEASMNHHDLGLFSIGNVPAARGAGLYHLAWQVDTIDELAVIRKRMIEFGAIGGESDHGVSKSIYGHDPDGIEFEVMWMVPESDWGTYAVDAVVAPLDLAAELSRWSGVATRI
jgi:catechol-2,3-dioxygenase